MPVSRSPLIAPPLRGPYSISFLVLQVLKAGQGPVHTVHGEMHLPLERFKAFHIPLFLQHRSDTDRLWTVQCLCDTAVGFVITWHANQCEEAVSHASFPCATQTAISSFPASETSSCSSTMVLCTMVLLGGTTPREAAASAFLASGGASRRPSGCGKGRLACTAAAMR